MEPSKLDVFVQFDLRRCGLVKVETDLEEASFKTTIDGRGSASIHNEMEDVINQSPSNFYLSTSNSFNKRWLYLAIFYILVLIPLNIFLMLYSTKKNSLILFILSILCLICTTITIYYMEYYYNFTVYSFLSWSSKMVITLRNYALNKFNKNTKHLSNKANLKCGLSYNSESHFYSLIAHSNDNNNDEYKEENEAEIEQEYILYYKFNQQYITPIIYESFEMDKLFYKGGIESFNEWNKWIQEIAIIFDGFREKLDVKLENDDINLYDKDLDIDRSKVFKSSNNRMRIKLVHQHRLNKVKQSMIKQIRRVFIVFGLFLIIGVPLIVNDDHESMTSFNNISTWIMVEGILFFVFALLTMPLCCSFYQNSDCCKIFACSKIRNRNNKINDNDDGTHKQQLVVDDDSDNDDNNIDHQIIDIKNEQNKHLLCCGDSELWQELIINELDDFCEYMNMKNDNNKYSFKNEIGFYNAPNKEPYTGKITITSNCS